MSTMTKVFIVLNSVLAIVLSCLTVASAARWSNAQEQVQSYEQLYQAEFVRRLNLEAVMATSLAMKDDALKAQAQLLEKKDEELRKATDDLADGQNRLAAETNNRAAAEAGQKKLLELLNVQTGELNSTRKHNQDLLTEKIDLQTRNQLLASRVLETTSQLTVATDEIRNLQEKLYASEQRAKALEQRTAGGARQPEAGEPPTGAVPVTPVAVGPIRGEIVQIDGRYVSLNVGETSGVIPGMVFMVHRGDTYLADIEIDNVRPKEAGGKLTMVAAGQAVQRGDRVVSGLK